MFKPFVSLAFALLFAQGASAGETPIREFPLPGHGALAIAVPDAWQVDVEQPGNDLPPTLKFTAKTGPAFEFYLTPLWPMDGKAPPLDAASLHKQVADAAETLKPQSVEKTIETKSLKGAGAVGYYFSATDRAPKPGEYKYVTQGILPVGELATTFTILSNDGSEAVVKTALLLLRGATQKKTATP